MGGLSDTVSKLYRELHAKLFCSAGADVFLLDQAWMASGDHHRQRGIEPCSANTYAYIIDGIQVYAAGESNRSGGLNKDYVIGARARGVRGSVIIWKNVMKSSMLTIITLLALSIGNLLGGTTIVETIFMWDGVGKMAVDAISMRDYPIIQAYVMWMAIIYVVVNLLTDLSYRFLDPRIRLGGVKQ